MSASDARLSIREISRRIDVPESTLRYYRNTFGPYIPTVGSGRNRRHPEEAVEVYKTISRLFAAGESRETIRSRLEAARQGEGAIEWSEVERPPPGQLHLDIADVEPVEVFSGGASLRAREIEQLISALMMRDRELTQMHRELLDVLTRLIEVMESRIVALAPADGSLEPGSEAAAAASADAEDLEERLEEIDSLRESLAQEQETVERLRRAKLELEQRLIRLEREK